MTVDLFKYPSTPHLTVLGGNTFRGDKVLSPAKQAEFLSDEIVVEEKLDGANLGISFDSAGNIRAQNRGDYLRLPAPGQWQPLQGWLNSHVDSMFETLSEKYILFGEWCYATHSVFYNRLPDWFIGFDIYDTEADVFLDVSGRNAMLGELKIYSVPLIACGVFSLGDVEAMLAESVFGSEPAEGIYLRRDETDVGFNRAKIVREDFIQAIDEHWSRKSRRINQLASTSCNQP